MNKMGKFLADFLETKVSLGIWTVGFLALVTVRYFIEQFMARTSGSLTTSQSIVEYIHNLYFFLLAILLIWLLVSFIMNLNPKRMAILFLWSSVLMVVPPIIDMLKTGGQIYWSFYVIGGVADLVKQFTTIFGHFPSGIVYFGTRITFISAIILISSFVFIRTRNILKAAVTALFTYVILFFMGSFPSLFSLAYLSLFGGRNLSDIKPFNVVQFFGGPQNVFGAAAPGIGYSFPYNLDFIYFPFLVLVLAVFFFAADRKKFRAVLKNFRYPQIIYHTGLFIVGMGLGCLIYPQNFNFTILSFFAALTLVISIWLAWKASVVVNDVNDLEIDKISNPARPLPQGIFSEKEYWQFGLVCLLLSFLGALSVGTNWLLLILVYQIIAWFYSARPFRLKKFPGVASAVSSLASLMVLFMGFTLISGDDLIQHLSWRIILLLFLAYMLAIPIKDFKDIVGDGKEKIWTIPVLFGDSTGRLVVSICIFVAYMLSVFLLGELRLFFWALIFGIITFVILNYGKIKPRQLPGVILGVVGIYGLILVLVMFV